jgi:hypothetical protein
LAELEVQPKRTRTKDEPKKKMMMKVELVMRRMMKKDGRRKKRRKQRLVDRTAFFLRIGMELGGG